MHKIKGIAGYSLIGWYVLATFLAIFAYLYAGVRLRLFGWVLFCLTGVWILVRLFEAGYSGWYFGTFTALLYLGLLSIYLERTIPKAEKSTDGLQIDIFWYRYEAMNQTAILLTALFFLIVVVVCVSSVFNLIMKNWVIAGMQFESAVAAGLMNVQLRGGKSFREQVRRFWPLRKSALGNN